MHVSLSWGSSELSTKEGSKVDLCEREAMDLGTAKWLGWNSPLIFSKDI